MKIMDGILRQKFLCSPRLTENEIPVGIIEGERRNRIRDDPRALIEREKSKKTYWISSNTFEEIIIDVQLMKRADKAIF